MKTKHSRTTLIIIALATTLGAQGQNRLANGSFEVSKVTDPWTSTTAVTAGGLLEVDSWIMPIGGDLLSNSGRHTNGTACVQLQPNDIGIVQEFNIMPDRTNGRNLVVFDYGLTGVSGTPYSPQVYVSLWPTGGTGGVGKSDLYSAALVPGVPGNFRRSDVAVMDITDSSSGMARIDAFCYNSPMPVTFDNFYVFNMEYKPATPGNGDFDKTYGFSAFNNMTHQGNLSSLRSIDNQRCRVASDYSSTSGWLVAGYWFPPTSKPVPTTIECRFKNVKCDWKTGNVNQWFQIWDWTNRKWVGLNWDRWNMFIGPTITLTDKDTVGRITGTGTQLANYFDPITKTILFKTGFQDYGIYIYPGPGPVHFQTSVDQVQVEAW